MKLPEGFLREYLLAQEKEHIAILHLGRATQEYETHKARLMAQAAEHHAVQDKAVRHGLGALGLDIESKEHHYHVLTDGTVKEIVAGEFVEVSK